MTNMPTPELTVFERLKNPIGSRRSLPWDDLFGAWTRSPKCFAGDEHPGWSPATFVGDQRGRDEVERLWALVLDVDEKNKTTLDWATTELCGWYGCIYTSRRHTTKAHRFRVVLPYTRPVTADEHDAIWRRFDARFPGHFDGDAKDAPRFWFTPGPMPGNPYETRRLHGEPLDPDVILAWPEPAPEPTAPRPPARDPGPSTGGRPGDDFNRRATWAQILEPHGWVLDAVRRNCEHWRRPGKDRGTSATVSENGAWLYVFSSGAPPLEANRHYDKFGAFAALEHGGDIKAAAKVLATKGYGEQRNPAGEQRRPAAEPSNERVGTAGDLDPDDVPTDPEAAAPGSTTTPPEQHDGVIANNTDLDWAERLAREHGQDMRYAGVIGGWFIWDGRRWKRSQCGEAERMAQATARAIMADAFHALADATATGDEDAIKKAKANVAEARRSQSRRALESMLIICSTLQGIATPHSAIDTDPWLLCCLNGTLDLRTGELRDHRREDLITKLCPVKYDSAATSEPWTRFLRDATADNNEMTGFIQRAVGYSLTGSTAEEVLFLIHGPQQAGKSTFMEAVKHTFGDYATTTSFETFLVRKDVGSPRNDIAGLAGARLVASIEVDEGKKLAAGLVKMMTGGDTVSARFLHKEFFEFKPTCKLWLVANHAPRVRADDGAMWRRILRLPFEQIVPKEKRDPKLKEELLDASVSGAAILAWAVRGAMLWREAGLGVPKIVTDATEEYRQEQDPLVEFFDERCILEPEAKVARRSLRQQYEQWCKDTGSRPIGAKSFSAGLRAKGITDGGTVRWGHKPVDAWAGIRLRDEVPEDGPESREEWYG